MFFIGETGANIGAKVMSMGKNGNTWKNQCFKSICNHFFRFVVTWCKLGNGSFSFWVGTAIGLRAPDFETPYGTSQDVGKEILLLSGNPCWWNVVISKILLSEQQCSTRQPTPLAHTLNSLSVFSCSAFPQKTMSWDEALLDEQDNVFCMKIQYSNDVTSYVDFLFVNCFSLS